MPNNGARLEPGLPAVPGGMPAQDRITCETAAVERAEGVPDTPGVARVRGARNSAGSRGQAAQPERVFAEVHTPIEPAAPLEFDRAAHDLMTFSVGVHKPLEPVRVRPAVRVAAAAS